MPNGTFWVYVSTIQEKQNRFLQSVTIVLNFELPGIFPLSAFSFEL
jgi:hypothetical protein